jgi:hypothetical protein
MKLGLAWQILEAGLELRGLKLVEKLERKYELGSSNIAKF